MNATDIQKEEQWWAEEGPAAPANWNFDTVPEEELIACCYWEYARESSTIKLVSEVRGCRRHLARLEGRPDAPGHEEDNQQQQAKVAAWVQRAGFDLNAFMDEYWKTECPLLHIYDTVTHLVGDEALPWQRLSPAVRSQIASHAQGSLILRPLAPALVGELEELWEANSTALKEVRQRERPENDDSEDAALWTESVPVEPTDAEENARQEKLTVALTVDFSRFTDGEILEAFQTWLKEKRPGQWRTPRRVIPNARKRGKKQVEYRVALERLGLMRLLHWYSPADLSRKLPAAWEKIRHKEPDFRREIREAARFFRSLFPFLPEQERPDTVERFGVWIPRMDKNLR